MAEQVNGIGTQTAIDELENKQNNYLAEQQRLNDQIVDKGLEKTKLQTDFQRQQYEQDATKTAKGLYADYQKQASNYGANAETIASQGLTNSGYSESSRVNLYNNYQRNVTSIVTELNREKAQLDLQINQAYIDADIQKAQNLANTYAQKMELAMNTYQLRYGLYRDQVADEQWQKQYELQLRQLEMSQANADRDYQLSLMQLQNS